MTMNDDYLGEWRPNNCFRLVIADGCQLRWVAQL